MSVTSPCCSLCFWLTGYRWEVPGTPFLGSNNLLEQFTEFTETFHLLDLQFIMLIKTHSGIASWKPCREESMGQGWGASIPSLSHLSPWISTCSPTWKEVSLLSHDWLNHWPLVIHSTSSPSSHPGSQRCEERGGGRRLKSFNPWIWSVLQETIPNPIHLTKGYHSHQLRNSKDFGNSEPGTGQRPNAYFSL